MAKKGVIKNRLYYKSSDMINIENIVLQNIRVDKKLIKDIITYYIRYGAVDGVKTCDFILMKQLSSLKRVGILMMMINALSLLKMVIINILNTTTEFYWYKNRHIKK